MSRKAVRYENAANRTSNAVSRRVRVPRTMTNGGVTTVAGSEIVGNVTLATGSILKQINIDPMTLSNTWLNRNAALYNKYKYVRCAMRYVPFVPTSQPGRLIMSWCADPLQNVANVEQVSQFQNARESPVWKECVCNFMVGRTPEYTISSSDEEDAPGKFLIRSDYGTAADTTPQTIGSLYLDYTVQFWDRSAFAGN